MTLQGTNSYLVQPPGRPNAPCILVDTTQQSTSEPYVKIVTDHLGSVGAPLAHIVLTHRHQDHTGGLVPLLRGLSSAGLPPPKIWKMANPDEARLQASSNEHENSSSDKQLEADLSHLSGLFTPGPTAAIHNLSEGEEVSVVDGDAAVSVKVVHTPGHTDDSISLVVATRGGDDAGLAVMTGDTVLGQGTTIFTDFGACKRGEIPLTPDMTSLKKLLALNPSTIYPAHGPHITGEDKCHEHLSTYIKHRQEREDTIVAAFQALHSVPGSLGSILDKLRVHAAESADAAVGAGGAGGASAEAAQKAAQVARDSSPIASAFPQAGEPGATAATVPLLCRVVYKSGHEGLIRAATYTMTSHVDKLVQEGRVRKVKVKLPRVFDWKVQTVEEVDAFEWCGEAPEHRTQQSSM